MKMRKSRDALVREIARGQEKRGFHVDVESVEATVAKSRAAEEDKLYGLVDSSLTLIEFGPVFPAERERPNLRSALP